MMPMYQDRVDRFLAKLQAEEGSAYLATKPENQFYLSGFSGDSAWLLLDRQTQILFTDSRYTQQAKEECQGWTVIQTEKGLLDALKESVAALGLRKLYFDQSHVSVATHARLRLALGEKTTLAGIDDPCAVLRQIKDAGEIQQIQHAARIADEALVMLRHRIRPGVTEREIATELYYCLGKLGSDGVAFATIAAAGPQGALPHAKPTDYRLAEGDFLTLDFGAVVGGYRSDITRTFVLGKPDQDQAARYTLVLEAQERALRAIKPGATMRAIDHLARGYLAEAGYGEAFGHGLGHSFGLEIHEEPRFSPLAEDAPLRQGMAMTVEPGIYLPGWGGLRIEDCLIVTEDGAQILSKYPKTLEEMTIIW